MGDWGQSWRGAGEGALNDAGTHTTRDGDDDEHGHRYDGSPAGRAGDNVSSDSEDNPAGSKTPSNVTSTAITASSTTDVPAAPQKYIPRWKRDANAKPEPYKQPFKKPPPRAAGEHYIHEIADKLTVSTNHSFPVAHKQFPLSSTEESSGVPLTGPTPVLELRAVLNYPGANPPAPSATTRIIWTRNHVEVIQASIGVAIPLFEHVSPDAVTGKYRVFRFEGHFKIEKAEIATRDEVLEFVKTREQSKTEKTAEIWQDKLRSQWLRVTLERASEEEQAGNPMTASDEQAKVPLLTGEKE